MIILKDLSKKQKTHKKVAENRYMRDVALKILSSHKEIAF